MAGALSGQAAIVTGAGRGFGRAIAQRFAAEGAAVTVTARSQNELDETVTHIERAGGRALAVAGDVSNRVDVARVVESAESRFGPVTLLVNNAGVTGPFGPLWTVDPDEWWRAQEVHVRGSLLFLRALLPGMVERQAGRIIHISAIAWRVVAPNLSGYCVAKRAQIRLAEHVAAETKEHGIAIFSIEPGTVVTALAEKTIASKDARRWLPNMVGRLRQLKQDQDPAQGLAKCAERCVQLASGRYDALSGNFLMPEDDLDARLREQAKP
jgi:NAD(P)-dependent dehydrogenase (short-subunit alcohol dehydrogenase family)